MSLSAHPVRKRFHQPAPSVKPPEKTIISLSTATQLPSGGGQERKTQHPQPETNNEQPTTNNASPVVEETPLDRSNKIFFFGAGTILGVVTIASISLTGWFRTAPLFHPPPASPAPTTSIPTATAVPPPQRAAIGLEVLNGSGAAGKAKKAADQLAALGYPIVAIGNAPRAGYPLTEVSVPSGNPSVATLILSDLTTLSYTATAAADLTDSTASARIIVGKK